MKLAIIFEIIFSIIWNNIKWKHLINRNPVTKNDHQYDEKNISGLSLCPWTEDQQRWFWWRGFTLAFNQNEKKQKLFPDLKLKWSLNLR